MRQAAQEGRIVTITCRGCGHGASFLASDIAAFADPDRPIEAVRFRCRECEGQAFDVATAVFDRDRKPDIIVWRPTRLR
ncbi:hypothetical protein ASG48_03555 [Aurantimonas sp. Leaf443]|nr:hypothetical protein ASG48_03555 [Aurantimonas sp. Leaf443]